MNPKHLHSSSVSQTNCRGLLLFPCFRPHYFDPSSKEDPLVPTVTEEFVSVFQTLLGSVRRQRTINLHFLQHIVRHTITQTEAVMLSAPVTGTEIKNALFDIPEDSAPGPDGYTSAFFKAAWPIIGQEVIEAIGEFIRTGRMQKVLHLLIDYSENAFVPGRSIAEIYCWPKNLQAIIRLNSHPDVQSKWTFRKLTIQWNGISLWRMEAFSVIIRGTCSTNQIGPGSRIWLAWDDDFVGIDVLDVDAQYVHCRVFIHLILGASRKSWTVSRLMIVGWAPGRTLFMPASMPVLQTTLHLCCVGKFRSKLYALKPIFRAQRQKKGDLSTNVRLAATFLDTAQSLLAQDRLCPLLLHLEFCCKLILRLATKLEQHMLQQRAKLAWMKGGDQCSRIFFRKVAKRRASKRIFQIMNTAGQILTDQQDVINEFIAFYQALLGGERRAVFAIDEDKAPGPDGYPSGFFKAAWSVIGKEVTQAILDFFTTGRLLKQVNATLLSLNPKDGGFAYHWRCEALHLFQLGFADDLLKPSTEGSRSLLTSQGFTLIHRRATSYCLDLLLVSEIPFSRYWTFERVPSIAVFGVTSLSLTTDYR
ncbi:UNVERIFIED_CONTAM: hypothetical protein Slati_0884700 [Sesamum latifolium]|uniref:Reverse transcriptase n=1 Tax=Sesamum latifolium TaxID=2727402 RepID=A0AAW2XN33_9LAMI